MRRINKKLSNTYMIKLKFVLEIFHSYWSAIVKIVIILIIIAAISILLPLLSAKLIDEGLSVGNQERVVCLSCIIFLINLIMSVLYLLCEKIRIKAYNSIQYELRKKAVSKIFRINIDYFDSNNASSIFQKINTDIDVVSGVFSIEIILSVLQMIVTIGYLIAMVRISLKLTLLLLAFMPIKLMLSFLIAKLNVDITECANDSVSEYSSWFGELISSIKNIRFYNMMEYFTKEFNKRQKIVLELDYKKRFIDFSNSQIETIIIQFTLSAIYILSGYLLIDGELTLGHFFAVQTYAITLLTFISQFFDLIFAMSGLYPSISRYYEFLSLEDETNAPQIMHVENYELHFRNISFSYFASFPVLKFVNIDFPYGSKTAIVGNNGAGKTTLFNLITRLYMPVTGEILIGDINIESIEIRYYRSLFSIVGQQVFLFNDSIRNNICLYKDISQSELDQVLKCVELDNVVAEKTLDFMVGENGNKLSGGQRQKISLARAIVNKSQIYLFDEVSSSIDMHFEAIMSRVINDYCSDKTVICITHRPNLLKLMDRVVSIEDGKIKDIMGKDGGIG